MKRLAPLACLALTAQAAPPQKPAALAPSEIVAAAPASDWVAIAASDLLVMDLAPLAGKPRRVVIQLIPPPFSQGWVSNIRKLAAAKWWDGTSINRVQDNYVVQWGDASEKKPLPKGLRVVTGADYLTPYTPALFKHVWGWSGREQAQRELFPVPPPPAGWTGFDDPYADQFSYAEGFPVAMTRSTEGRSPTGRSILEPKDVWPVHCYAMVGVGRNLAPDTGSGAELYTVIGHAPRHLDRNIALVGRVIEGIEHLSSLPRGTEALGFYKSAEERVPIVSVRLGNDVQGLGRFEYLSTESASFARYADARANRRDAFFNVPAGGADICNIPVPVRRAP